MSNLFEEVMDNASAAQEKYLGPDYPYYKNIRSPSQIGMSGEGSLSQLGKDISGLEAYVELLVSGKGKASATGRPLGNKFFLKTGGKCTDVATKEEVDRFIYVNNVPSGNIPFISSGMGMNFKDFRGLIPGTISNLNAFNPMEMFQAFLSGSKPDCQSLTMETVDIYNNRSTETNFVTLVDIQNMDACSFDDKKNPVSGAKCQNAFSTMEPSSPSSSSSSFNSNKDPLTQTYFAILGILSILILHGLMKKYKMA